MVRYMVVGIKKPQISKWVLVSMQIIKCYYSANKKQLLRKYFRGVAPHTVVEKITATCNTEMWSGRKNA